MKPHSLTIAGPIAADSHACEAVLRSLPDWFAHEESLLEYATNAAVRPTWTAALGNRLAGFLTVLHHFSTSAEVYAMAVHADFRNQRIGRRLLETVESSL